MGGSYAWKSGQVESEDDWFVQTQGEREGKRDPHQGKKTGHLAYFSHAVLRTTSMRSKSHRKGGYRTAKSRKLTSES